MVHVEICRPQVRSGEVAWEKVATVHVDGGEHEIEDPAGVLDRDRPMLVAGEGRSVTWAEDPESWARSLPGGYRGPDLLAVVVEDSNPPQEPDVTRADVHVSQTARELATS